MGQTRRQIVGGLMTLGVCMVTTDFYPRVGGMQTHTLALAQHLRATGVDVLVITRRYEDFPLYEEVGGLPIYRVNVHPNASRARAMLQFLTGALRLMTVEQHRFQIIHSHQVISPTTIGLIGRELMRKKLIVNPHSPKQGGGLRILLQERPCSGRPRLFWMKKRADVFIAISQEIERDLTDLGFPPDKIVCIPNGVDTTRFSPLSTADKAACRHDLGLSDGPILIYAGRLSAVKQLDVLLRAFAGLAPRFSARGRLLIVGEGEELEHLKSLAIELGIGQQVVFVGPVLSIERYLQASDVFVLPSQSEGLPLALLEAMACGLPCVASATGGVLDVVRSKINGLTVPAGDVCALQKALEALWPNSSKAAQLGRQARLDICRQYSIEQTAQSFLELYHAVLSASPSRSVQPKPLSG
jgi:glycosyltransferase involved in cell wall biosynthesis